MKRFLPLLLGILLSLPVLAQQPVYTDNGWKFTVADNKAYITGHTQSASALSGALVVPSSLSQGASTYPVVSVVGFKNYKLLTSLTLPAGLLSIDNQAFAECTGLQGTLDLPVTVTSISASAFLNCSGFTGNLVIPNSVTTLGSAAFSGCSGFNGTLTLSNQLTTLENDVFRNCSRLTGSLEIPAGVTRIGQMAFANDSLFNGTLQLPEGLQSVDGSAFNSCTRLTGDLILPDGLTTIGGGAFANCRSLDGNFRLPASLTSMGKGAFRNCHKLKGQLNLPLGLTVISPEVFWACESLTGGIYIPDGVTEIGYDAFRNNPGLTGTVRLPSSLRSIGKRAFFSNSGLTGDLTIPAGVTSIGEQAFELCSGLTGTLTLSPALPRIERRTFKGCTGLTGDLTIPAGVTSIGEQAFEHCSSFTGTLTLPESLDTIQRMAFSNCSALTGDLVIPEGMLYVGDEAFLLCTGFNGRLSLPSTLRIIREQGFADCTSLQGDVILPASLSMIGPFAFRLCGKLTSFTLAEGSALTEPLGGSLWESCAGLEYIDLKHLPLSALAQTDFSRWTSLNQPFFGTPTHTVVYLPDGANGSLITQSEATVNYVLEGVCKWFSVQDAHDYELPHGFTALKATYNNTSPRNYRRFDRTPRTVYLPYPATVPRGMRAYELARRNQHVNDAYEYYFQFNRIPEGRKLVAYTPYLVVVAEGDRAQFGADMNVEVPKMPTPEESAVEDQSGEWLFCGTTEKISNADAAAQGAYNLGVNVWLPIKTSTPTGYVNHFRCFIKPKTGVSPTRSFAIFLNDDADTETGIAEAQEALSRGAARIYDLQGQYLGTDFEALPEGLYIVNGKKVYKM